MKNIFSVAVVILSLASSAQAYSIPQDVQVVNPPASATASFDPQPSSFSLTASDVNRAVKKGMSSVNTKLDAVAKKGTELEKKLNGTATLVDALGNKMEGQKKALISIDKKVEDTGLAVNILGQKIDDQSAAVNAASADARSGIVKVENLERTLTDDKNGAFKKLSDTVWSAGKEVDKSLGKFIGWMTFWVVLVMLVGGAVNFYYVRRMILRVEGGVGIVDEKVVKVYAAVDKIPEKVRKLEESSDLMGGITEKE